MGYFSDALAGLFGDADWTDIGEQSFADNVMSDLLPYRVYDPEAQLYHNENTVGFMVEANPVVGGPEVAGALHAAIMSNFPAGGTTQFLNWASPNIDQKLAMWSAPRMNRSPLVSEMADSRIRHFKQMRFGTDAVVKCIPHTRRIFVAAWIDGGASMHEQRALMEYRCAIMGAFGGETASTKVEPVEFLRLMADILHCGDAEKGRDIEYSADMALNYQLSGGGLRVKREGLGLMGEPPMSLACATVRRFPPEWAFDLGALLNGAPERINDRPSGPVLTSFTIRAMASQEAGSFVLKKRTAIQHAMKTKFGEMSHDIGGKREEFDNLNIALESGEKLFETIFSVSAYALGEPSEAKIALGEITKIYRHAGIQLQNDTFIQLPIFLTSLPFVATKGQMGDMKKLQRMRLVKGEAVTALAPLHGEWRGAGSGKSVLLVGRQGEVFDWDNFDSDGNYNVAVVGKSGAGKSVFMQELVTAIYASGGKTIVIDDGNSFKTTCEILEGRWIGFDGSAEIRLNPFSMLSVSDMVKDEYRADAIELVTNVVATMCSLSGESQGRVVEIEEGFIAAAVGKSWDEKGRDAEVTDVLGHLIKQSEEEERLLDVVEKLKRFCVGGIYGQYFQGAANVGTENDFTVFELSHIKGQKGFEDVVLQIIMFLGTELMYKTDRSTRVAILIDEAWDLLGGVGTSRFIEGVVRRARKYTGSLITGTQSIDDYYGNAAANVCLQNSDWLVMLAQKPETIERMAADKKLSVGPNILLQLKSLQSIRGQFSEMAIKGPLGWSFGRLVLDPFSLAVYSSKGATVERLRQLKSQGLKTVDALKLMVERGEVE